MGILFNTNSWRAPLQLIDCWLPAPSKRSAIAANEPIASRVAQRFARAGWLGRHGASTLSPSECSAPSRSPAVSKDARRVRVLRQTDPTPIRASGMRLVISGRINDVCAELDRLAEQESQVTVRVA